MSQKKKLLPIALGLLSLASVNALAAEALSLQGKTIGIAVVGTQHFWDREAYKGASEEVEKLGGKAIGVDGGRDNQVHANNHDILLSRKVDAVISILGDSSVEPKFKALRDAGIPVFTVDHVSKYSVNNTTSDNYTLGSTIGRYMADELGGKGNVAVFNAFSSSLRICGIRYDQWKYVLNGDEVFQVLCEKNDLISVPAHTPHWFDMGSEPNFTAIRIFDNPEGWIAQFTGDDIASAYPRLA